jgi:hypothetical protein
MGCERADEATDVPTVLAKGEEQGTPSHSWVRGGAEEIMMEMEDGGCDGVKV